MRNPPALATASTAQLAAQLAGHVVALRRGRSFDVPFMTGSPEHIVRDWLWFGTAYSAPPYLLVPQIWATARLVRGPDDRARWVLRWLGTCVTVGYLSERLVRLRVRPSGFDPVETPIVVLGWGGVIAMALLGRRAGRRNGAHTGPTARARPSVLGMPSRGLLVATSAAQLAAQLAGLTVALRRGRYFDVGFMRGSAEHIRRDALWNGTAYSAPGTMLLAQLWAVRRLAAGPDDLARRVLGLLGAVNVPGYLFERFFRQHLRPRGWDAVETPVLVASLALAAGMAVLGHRAQAGR